MSDDRGLEIRNRDKSVDYLKAIGIMLVIIGHINFANGVVKAWIYSFHMPLFFFATGLVYNSNKCKRGETRNFINKKVNALLIPYFLWGLVYAKFSWSNLVRIIYGSYKTIIESGSLSSLWFLPAMFVAINIVWIFNLLLVEFNLNKLFYWLFCLCIIYLLVREMPVLKMGYPFCFNVATMGAGFIIMGYLTKKVVNKYLYNKNVRVAVCILFFAFTFLYRLNLKNRNYILMANAEYENLFLFLLTAYCGCVFIYLLAIIISNYKTFSKIFIYIGQNTLTIFAVHKAVIAIFEKFFIDSKINPGIQLCVTFLGVLFISYIICLTINSFLKWKKA